MKVICGKGPLAKPATNDVEFVVNKRGGMPIAPHRRRPVRLFGLDPHVLLRVKYPQTRVILLPVVAAKDPKLASVESCSVIFYLWCAAHDWTELRLR